MKGLFGTDGIRGKANSYPMTPEIAFRLGRALAYYCNRKKGIIGGCRIIIGKDTRLSGYMLEHSLVGGITSIGAKALLVGPMPTPAMAFLVQSMRADAAIVISASHNPYEDNGLKLFSSHGTKFPYEVEEKLEELILQEKIDNIRAYGANIGKAYRIKDANGRYIVFAKSTFPQALSLSGLKIAIDCANGASYQIAPTIFGELGAEVSAYGISPDGTNINKDCGALYPENIAGKTIEKNADIGIAFDGDGDRAIFSDEKGNIVDGDMVISKNYDLGGASLVFVVSGTIAMDDGQWGTVDNVGGVFIAGADFRDCYLCTAPNASLQIDGAVYAQNMFTVGSRANATPALASLVVNFAPRQIGPAISEVLTLGVPDEKGDCVLIKPEREVPLGGKMY